MVFDYIKSGYNKIKNALSRARSFFGRKLHALFGGQIDETMLEQLEQLLYEADFGHKTAVELTEKVRELHRKQPNYKAEDYLAALKSDLLASLKKEPLALTGKPTVVMIVGVNGNGKTTSVAKLAHLFSSQGRRVLVGAADTFRAAASEQLDLWASQVGVDIVKGKAGSDPASVAFDAIQAAKARGSDLVLLDTAGRLHTKTGLMQELEKIRRVCHKANEGAPHETLLVLDATTGQNAVEQAKEFHKFTPLTGIILTKLDGTAKGGIVVAIQKELGLPIKFVGTGEQREDLQPFDPEAFVEGLFE